MYLQPGSYNMYWMIESSALPDIALEDGRNLRDVVSIKGVSFGQLVRPISDDLYSFRFARSFDHIEDPTYAEQIYLDGDQFERAIPWCKSLEYLTLSELREQIQAHAPKDTCIALIEQEQKPPATPPTPVPSPSSQEEEIEVLMHDARSLECTVYVSVKTVEETQQAMEDSKEAAAYKGISNMRAWLQWSWLRAALNSLLRQIALVSEQSKLSGSKGLLIELEATIRRVLVSRHHYRQRLVKAEPVYFDKRQIGWYVKVDVPLALVA
jgi:hypothetical protein